ncbi:MAG TPA: type II secretion system inner membrane protein GspF [Burkholderiales bacterium]|nr:type II secretion system inner membrane protein GspF [Burkholderiales bacterium]
MSGFEYSALEASGRETRGVIEADTERHARSLLRERGLAPLAVEGIRSAAAQPGRRTLFSRPGLSRSGLALVTRQFATLARAGLTIEECLNVLIEQTESAGARTLFAAVRARVLEGQSLSHGLAAFPGSFPPIYRALIEAGEQSGRLGDVLERLADYTENRENLRDKVMLAFIYPAIVTVVAFAVVGLLLVYVVPQVTRVFTNLGQTLPLVTRILIAMSDFVRASGAFWLAGLVIAFVAGRLLLRDEARRRRWHGALLRLPLAGRLIRGVNAARFADTLGLLTASGVPLLTSLQSAAAVVTNLPMRAAVEEAVRRVREGESLAPALGAAKLFPPLVIHLIASGEATGRLDTMLARAAEAQARELENWTRGLTALLEPILILAMGGIVLFVVVAILLPIFEMNQLVR